LQANVTVGRHCGEGDIKALAPHGGVSSMAKALMNELMAEVSLGSEG